MHQQMQMILFPEHHSSFLQSLPLVHNIQLYPGDHSLLLVTTANKSFDNKFKVPLELS